MLPRLAELWPFALLALVGSVHCAGMCGGFALSVARGRRDGRALTELALYVLGKAATYAVLGLLAARVGALAAHAGAHALEDGGSAEALGRTRAALAWLAGGALVLLGLHGLGLFRPLARRLRAPRLLPLAAAARLYASVRALPPLSAALGVGLLTGLLPCGLSWSAFLLATQASPQTAALGLFVFGLATGPALAAVGLGPSLLPVRVRQRAALLVAPTLVLFGLFTIVRGGLPAPLARAEEALPSCCQPPE